MDRSLNNITFALDLEKAFDTVNHEMKHSWLMASIIDSATDLLSSYLTGRKQKCEANGISS